MYVWMETRVFCPFLGPAPMAVAAVCIYPFGALWTVGYILDQDAPVLVCFCLLMVQGKFASTACLCAPVSGWCDVS